MKIATTKKILPRGLTSTIQELVSSPRIGLQMLNNKWDRLKNTLKWCFEPNPHLFVKYEVVNSSLATGEDRRGAEGSMGDRWGMWLSSCMNAEPCGGSQQLSLRGRTQRAFDRVSLCNWYTRPLCPPSQTLTHSHLPETTELHPHTSRALHCSLWFTFTASSQLQRAPCLPPHPPATHHISGCLIQFCKGNERKASCAVGWGVLLS